MLQQQRQIIQQQEQSREKQLDKLRQGPPLPPDRIAKDKELSGSGKSCVKVHTIVFEGAAHLDGELKRELRQPFIGRCIGIVDIMSLVKVVTNIYIEQGYVTTRVYPPEQDLSKGTLRLKVIEGRTEAVTLLQNGKERWGIDTAFPYLVGERLYIRDIEQGLDQINRLPGYDAKIAIEPGEAEGASIVKVDARHPYLPVVTETFDNLGLKTVGEWQLGSTVAVGDLFGLYDSWAFTHKTSKPFYERSTGSEEYSVSASFPFGYWSLFLSASHFDYRSLLQGQWQSYQTSGNSKYYTAELERVLTRDRDSKTRLAVFVNYKDTANFVEGVRLETSSRALNVVGARLSHTHRLFGGLLDANLNGQWGVPAFGSLTDAASLPGSPRAEFGKVGGDVSFYRPLALKEIDLAVSVKAAGQFSTDHLYSTEQISLGGFYSVRGFKTQSLSGDSGGYVRNELLWTLPNLLPEEARPFINRADVFAGFDAGGLLENKESAFEYGSLTGLAGGLRLSSGALFGEVSYQHPLTAPQFIARQDQFCMQAGLMVKW